MRLAKLSNERDRISATVSYDLGGPINNDLLPPIKTEWENLGLEATQSSIIALSEAIEKKANSELSLARSEAFPELHLGPKLRYNTGEKSDTTIGFSLSMTLPILNQNNGAKESARYNLQRTSLETAITKTKINTERELLIKSYNRSAGAIKHAQATTRLNERHKSLHKLISQGVVSASLVIELHRQLFEYQSALHDQEITGIEALWKLYAIDGSIAGGQE